MNHALFLSTVVLSLLMSPPAAADERFRREAGTIQEGIDGIVSSTVGAFAQFQKTKATHLERYGAVFTLEAALEPPRNPFFAPKAPPELRASVTRKLREIREKVIGLLKERVAAMESVPAEESVAVIVYLVNSNPVDLPDMPSQLVISVKRQDVLDAQAGRLTVSLDSRFMITEVR